MKVGIFLICFCVIFMLTEAQIVIKAAEKKCFKKEDYVRSVFKILVYIIFYKKKLFLVHI